MLCKKLSVVSILIIGVSASFGSLATVTASIGVIGSHLTYREDGVRHQGFLHGIAGTFMVHRGGMFRLKGEYLTSHQIDYTSHDSGTMDNMSDEIYEIQAVVGPDLSLRSKMVMTPYAGIGYRYLNNDTAHRMTSTGAQGYRREQTYTYLPLGMTMSLPFGGAGWRVNTTVEYDVLLQGRNHSYLSVVPGYTDVSLTQSKGAGIQANVRLIKVLNHGRFPGLVLTPYVKYWNIKRSNTRLGASEPNNSTTEWGMTLSAIF